MGENNIKKRLIIVVLALVSLLIMLAAWLTQQTNKSYQVKSIAGTELYIPTELLGPKPTGLIDMVRAYIEKQAPQVRLQVFTTDLLDKETSFGRRIDADNRVVFTIESNDDTTQTGHLTQADTELLKSLINGSDILSQDASNKLLKVYRNSEDKSAVSFTNIDPEATTITSNIWLAHCVTFRALRENDSWGRCSRQIILKPFKISMHYDGLLVEDTTHLSNAVLRYIEAWATEPSSLQ